MSQDFKLKFDSMRNSNPSAPENSSLGNAIGESEFYPTLGNNRNLCFVWPDGKRMFLNYAYLISGELDLESTIIRLHFSTHLVQVEGCRLNLVFDQLIDQVLRILIVQDTRYKLLNESNPIITRITSSIIE